MMAPMTVRMGFIGLGQMGSIIAGGLLSAGYELTVWDVRDEAVAPFAARGAQVARSAAELAAGCDIVGLCVVDDAQTRDVAEGDSGVLAAMRTGSVLVLHSTISPRLARTLGEQAAARGVQVVDAPVSRATSGPAGERIVVMVGGDDAPVGTVMPVLRAFGDPVLHLGPLGSGLLGKLVNQSLQSANAWLGEGALRLGEVLGLDVAVLGELLRTGSGRSFGLELALMARTTDMSQGLALLRKDVHLMAAAADDAGVESELVALSTRFFTDGS